MRLIVSTHSRPKAAGRFGNRREQAAHCFNSQPPEGGWSRRLFRLFLTLRFNSQPPEGGWLSSGLRTTPPLAFQLTAARRRLGTKPAPKMMTAKFQLTAARRRLGLPHFARARRLGVSTHSRPKAAGIQKNKRALPYLVSTHSRPKAAGRAFLHAHIATAFQLTAARRRLAVRLIRLSKRLTSFNSQPPEGGWHRADERRGRAARFNSQPPEGGWLKPADFLPIR